jgi:hypothetical protein
LPDQPPWVGVQLGGDPDGGEVMDQDGAEALVPGQHTASQRIHDSPSCVPPRQHLAIAREAVFTNS